MVTRGRCEWCGRRRRGAAPAARAHAPRTLLSLSPCSRLTLPVSPSTLPAPCFPAHPLATALAGLPKTPHAVRRRQPAHPASTSSAHLVSVASLQLSLAPLNDLDDPLTTLHDSRPSTTSLRSSRLRVFALEPLPFPLVRPSSPSAAPKSPSTCGATTVRRSSLTERRLARGTGALNPRRSRADLLVSPSVGLLIFPLRAGTMALAVLIAAYSIAGGAPRLLSLSPAPRVTDPAPSLARTLTRGPPLHEGRVPVAVRRP